MIVSVTTSDTPQMARDYATKVGATFPIVFDDSGVHKQLFGVNATPTNLMIDRQGRIYFTEVGYEPGTEKNFQAQLDYLLKKS